MAPKEFHMRTLIVALLLAAPAAPTPAAPIRVGDRVFPAEVSALGDTSLQLKGAGLLRWRWVVKVYAAALYVGDRSVPFDPASDAPRRLEFDYLVSIERAGFGKAADELLARNHPPEELAPLRERIARLHAAYVDVKPGDRYALTYVKGRGTELTFNGERLALVEGDDFARTYFSIWLGREPIDGGLRDSLLGR
jgi:hypothetical protein